MAKNDNEWFHVKIPRVLAMKIKTMCINERPDGYKTVAAFVTETVRIKTQYLENPTGFIKSMTK
jgi:hypothetical protein